MKSALQRRMRAASRQRVRAGASIAGWSAAATIQSLFLLLCAPQPAQAAGGRVTYALTIGVNTVPSALRGENDMLRTLRFADDDAVQFHLLMRELAQESFLLSVLDADTQRRFPGLASGARVPSQVVLEQTVEHLHQAMLRSQAAGQEAELVLFYSGHGVRLASGESGLALQDNALTQHLLYERILSRLPARFVHLIVDSCHAEAVVRPRDAEASLETLESAERKAWLSRSTLARFPHVGVVLAATAAAQSFEWDAYRAGVFAHQVLSGLRGGADVNRDARVEYSELAAFLAAANQRVSDPRARLDLFVRPPALDRRAPLVTLSSARKSIRVHGRASGGWEQPFYIENDRGVRVADVLLEPNSAFTFTLPAGERVFLVRNDAELELLASAGAELHLSHFGLRPRALQSRGSVERALAKGLFATAFGPSFYQGYVSQHPELTPVNLDEAAPTHHAHHPAQPSQAKVGGARSSAGAALLVASGAAALTAGVFGGLMLDARREHSSTSIEREAADAHADYDRYRTLTWVGLGTAALTGAAGAALLLWPQPGSAQARNRSGSTQSSASVSWMASPGLTGVYGRF